MKMFIIAHSCRTSVHFSWGEMESFLTCRRLWKWGKELNKIRGN